MADLQLFNFENQQIRVIEINDEPWWVASDICQVLEIANSRDAVSRLEGDEKCDVGIADSLGRTQNTSVVNEAGLFSLVLTSRKPQAKAFKRWLTHEVLPTLRKTGRYEIAQNNSAEQMLQAFITQQTAFNQQLMERTNKLDQIERAGEIHPGCKAVLDGDVDELNYVGITAQQYLVSKNLGSWEKARTFAKRAANMMRLGKRVEDLPKDKGKVIYYANDIKYLEQALIQLLGLD